MYSSKRNCEIEQVELPRISKYIDMRVIEKFTTKGCDYERGCQQGIAMRNHAKRWFNTQIKSMMKAWSEDSFEVLLKKLWPDLKLKTEGFDFVLPSVFKECCGIAKGMGVSIEEYFMVIFALSYLKPCFNQCTSVGYVLPHGRVIMGKTDDIPKLMAGMNVIETVIPNSGYRHIHIHFAGTPWTVAGINEAGLSIAMTGIYGPRLDILGVPSLVALRPLLNSYASVLEAMDYLKRIQIISHGFSLLMGDVTGDLKLIEKTALGIVEVPPNKKGVYIHTNHILDPVFYGINPVPPDAVVDDSKSRQENIQKMILQGERSFNGMKTMLSYGDQPGAIYKDGSSDGKITDFVTIFQPSCKEMRVWRDNPMESIGENLCLKD